MKKANQIDKEIGKRIELYRKLRSKTRYWLAEKLGVSYNQVQYYEIGKHRISASNLFIAAEALDFEIKNFFPLILKNEKNEKNI